MHVYRISQYIHSLLCPCTDLTKRYTRLCLELERNYGLGLKNAVLFPNVVYTQSMTKAFAYTPNQHQTFCHVFVIAVLNDHALWALFALRVFIHTITSYRPTLHIIPKFSWMRHFVGYQWLFNLQHTYVSTVMVVLTLGTSLCHYIVLSSREHPLLCVHHTPNLWAARGKRIHEGMVPLKESRRSYVLEGQGKDYFHYKHFQ